MANIENIIKIDLLAQGVLPEIDIMQGDAFTRDVKIHLYVGAVPFVPSNYGFDTLSVAFVKPDGKSGWYEELPDKTPAVEYTSGDSYLIARLAPAISQVAGKVKAAVIMRNDFEKQAATFPFILNVIENPAFGSSISNNYYAVKNLEELNAALSLVVSADKEQNFTEEQKAKARQNIGALSESFLQDFDQLQQDINYLRRDMDQVVLPVVDSAVTVNEQTLTDDQKAQARENIGAMKHGNVTLVSPDGDEIEVAGENSIKDDDGYTIAGCVGFYAKDNDQKVILTHIHDGIEDSDVATVGQVSEQLDIATKDFVKKDDNGDIDLNRRSIKNASDLIAEYLVLTSLKGIADDKIVLTNLGIENGVSSLSFANRNDSELVRLRHIADGIDDNDAVTLGQIRQEVETDGLLLADEEGSVYVSAESPEKDDEGYIAAGRVSFYAGDDDQQVILTNIHDGIRDDDAATVGQVKAAIESAIANLPVYNGEVEEV